MLIPGQTTHPLEWALICLDGRYNSGGAWHTACRGSCDRGDESSQEGRVTYSWIGQRRV